MISKELAAIEQAVKSFQAGMEECKTSNADFIPERRKERLKAAAGPLIQQVLSVCDEQRKGMDDKFKNCASIVSRKVEASTKPKSEIRELIDFLRMDSVKRELQTMSIADRGAAFRAACKAKDLTTIEAFRGTLAPLISPDLLEAEMQRLEAEKVQQAAPVESDILERLSDARSELSMACESTREMLVKQLAEFGLTPRDLSEVNTMTDSQKRDYIEKNGLDAFKKLVDGV